MAKPTYVEDLNHGDSVDSTFVVTSSRVHPYSNGYRLALRLADRTGKVDGVLWECAPDADKRFPADCVVSISGRVGEYNQRAQIVVERIGLVDESEVDADDFMPSSPYDPTELETELRGLVASIAHDGLRAVCEAFLADPLFERMRVMPGGKRWHHGYRHGLLEHTTSVMGLCARLCEHYGFLNRDIVLAAALLHDAGKLRELESGLSTDYTTAGRLLGHQVITLPIVNRLLHSVEGVSPRLALELLHTIAAHHGEQEGSLVKPMTREAAALHFADHIDATMNAWSREIDGARNQGHEWTGFVSLLGRFLYAGPPDDTGALDEPAQETPPPAEAES